MKQIDEGLEIFTERYQKNFELVIMNGKQHIPITSEPTATEVNGFKVCAEKIPLKASSFIVHIYLQHDSNCYMHVYTLTLIY